MTQKCFSTPETFIGGMNPLKHQLGVWNFWLKRKDSFNLGFEAKESLTSEGLRLPLSN